MIARPAFRPRLALAVTSCCPCRNFNASATVLAARSVLFRNASTVASHPISRASHTANVPGRQPRLVSRRLAGVPSRTTTIGPRRICAAPVSSNQPIPASDATRRAPADSSGAATRSGTAARASTSRTCRGHPVGSHATVTVRPASRIVDSPAVWATPRLPMCLTVTVSFTTALSAAATRSASMT